MEAKKTNKEDQDVRLSPKVMKEFITFVGKTYQQNLLRKLKTGPVNPYKSYGEVTLHMDVEEGCITIEATLDEVITGPLIEDILRKGFASQEDDGTLTGLGPYAEWELSCIEKKVLAVAKITKKGAITPVGVKRRLKDVEMSTREIKGVLDELVNKGYFQQEEVWTVNPLLKEWLMTHPLSPESLNEWLSLQRGSSSNAKI